MILYKRKNGIYYLKYRNENGREIRISSKCRTKKEANIFLSDFKKNLNKKPALKTYFLKSIYQLYLTHCQNRFSSKYHSIMKYTLETFYNYIGNVEMDEIPREKCEVFIMKKYSTAQFHANQFYRNLRAFFNWAVDNEYLELSPMQKIKPPKVPTKNPEWINEEELFLILENVENEKLRIIYQLLFYTGLRANELLNLTWIDIDLETKTIFIRNGDKFTTKTKQDRTLPLNKKALQIFLNQNGKEKSGLIFTKRGIRFNVDYISKKFKEAVRETSVNQKIHLHSLRHSYASNLVAKGVSLYHVSKLLGHTRISTTEKYSHVKIDDLRIATEQI